MALFLSTKASTPTLPKESFELLLIINCESQLKIHAIDNNGALVPNFSITTPHKSLPSSMGFTVIGSDLHMIGGFGKIRDNTKDMYSLKTYVLDVAKIPLTLASGHNLSESLTPGPPLHSAKIIPAVYVVRGCIYALSGTVHLPGSAFSDFEFRPREGVSWTTLPNPPVPDEIGARRSFVSLESHALVGERSIVVSLIAGGRASVWRGVYVFDLASNRWTTAVKEVSPVGFSGETTTSCGGVCYALSLSGSGIRVFSDRIDLLSSPVEEFKIREPSPEVSVHTLHRIAVMGGVVFVVRSGSPGDVPWSDLDPHPPRPVYITVDRYKVSLESNVESEPFIAELDRSDPLLLEEDHHFRGSSFLPYCLPVSLSR